MKDFIDEIEKLTDQLKDLLPLNAEWQNKLDKKFRLEFSYNSNHIEGNTLTYGETELLLIFEKTTGDHELREYEEVKAHDVAFKLIKDWATDFDRQITEQQIKELNEIILVRPYWKEAITLDGQATRKLIKIGAYKETPNSVLLQNGERFEYASPTDTPILMGELVAWYQQEENKKELHPVVLASLLHYKFVRIHPFDDGNGRLARLLMNYVLLRHNFPPVVIKSADKRNYLSALNKADVGDLNAFVEYVATQLLWSLNLSIKAAKNESFDEPDDIDKEISLLKRELSRENVLSAKADTNSVCDAIEEIAIPLFQLMGEKCATLNELFFDTNRRTEYSIRGKETIFKLGSKDSSWETLKQNWLVPKRKSNEEIVSQIKCTFDFTGLKKNLKGPSFFIGAEVYFDKYNVSIVLEKSNHPLVIPYGKKLSNSELQELITPAFRKLLDDIKQVANRT